MFKITIGKGFHIKFKNGYTISVQFGMGNYCDFHDASFSIKEYEKQQIERAEIGSSTAEIAILKDGKLITVEEWGDEIKGYCSPEEVLKWMNYAESLPKEPKND